jgi:HicB family
MPEDVKKKVSAAAAEADVSVNQWLLDAAQACLEGLQPAGKPSREAIVAGLRLVTGVGERLADGWTLVPPTTEQTGH